MWKNDKDPLHKTLSWHWTHEWLWGGLIHGELRKHHHIFSIEDIFAHMYLTCMTSVQVRMSLCIRYFGWFVVAMAGDDNGWILLSGLMSIGLWNLQRLGDFWQATLGGPQSKRLSSRWSATTPAALIHEIRGVTLLLPFLFQREVMHSSARRWICHNSSLISIVFINPTFLF